MGQSICIQVSQGNGMDCSGAIAGSLQGALLGSGHLEDLWLEPFDDRMHMALASFHEHWLSKIAQRVGNLPKTVRAQMRRE